MGLLESTQVFLGLLAATCVTSLTFTTSDCGKTKGCFVSPTSCSGSTDCDYLVTYKANESTVVEFELSAKAQYLGLGFSDDKFMPDTDILVCYKPGGAETTVDHFYASARSTPAKTTPTPSALKLLEAEFSDGIVKCRFTRETNPGITNFKDINQKVFLLVASGNVGRSGIQFHDVFRSSESEVNVKGTESLKAAAVTGVAALLQAHGSLMIIAWVVLASVGMFIARYTRVLWEDQTLFGGKIWFQVHRMIMVTAVLATIIGIILIFVQVGSWSKNAGAHPYFGIIVLALAVVQPIMAAFRPHPGVPTRYIFNWAHRGVGTSALILGVVTVFLGVYLPQVRLDMRAVYVMIVYCAGVGVIIAFEVALFLARRGKSSRTNSISGTSGGFQIQEPGTAQTTATISKRETMLRFVMLVFVILLVVAVATALIVLIATA